MPEKVKALTNDQMEFAVSQVVKWMHTCDDNKRGHSAVDASHSALLRRLLLGQTYHEYPPPTSMSYPNYDMLEKDTIQLFSFHEWDGRVVIDQNGQNWEWEDQEKRILRYKPTGLRFELFDGTAYPIAVSVGKPEDHPYPAKFLRRLPLQYQIMTVKIDGDSEFVTVKEYGVLSHAIRYGRYEKPPKGSMFVLFDSFAETWVARMPEEWKKLFEEEDQKWKPTSSK